MPVANAGIDKILTLPTAATSLSGSGSDPESGGLLYRWEKVSGPTATLSGTSGATLSLSNLQAGIYIFRLTVTDNFGQSAIDDAIVTVKDPNAPTNNYNYTKEEIIKKSGIKSHSQTTGLTVSDKSVAYTYLDESGNATEVIEVKGSPTQKDVVLPIVVDEVGRAATRYLPVATPGTGNGLYKAVLDANGEYTGDVANFYSDKPYARTIFESSPLSRVVEQGSEGQAWQPGSTSGTTKITYSTNAANEVRLWTISPSTGRPASSSSWPANRLKVVTSTDYVTPAKQTISQTISTVNGLTLVSRTKVDANLWAETYHVYDEFNNLRFVIPPALMKSLRDANNFNPTQDQVDRWCYQAQYDAQGRQIASKDPQTEWVYSVYDNKDRLVFSQTGNQRDQNQWSFFGYDEFNRTVSSGLYNPTSVYSRDDLQGLTASSASTRTGTDIVASLYDGYDEYRATNSITLKPGFTFSANSQNSFIATIGQAPNSSGEVVFPPGTTMDLSITYYDEYTGNEEIFANPEFAFVPETWTTTTGDPFVKFDRVKGSVTANSVRVLDTEQWLHTVYFYDQQQRLIQTISSIHTGGVSRSSSLYDFIGKVKETKLTQLSHTIIRRMEYDHAGRMQKVYHKFNNQPEVILASYEYNEIGQVTDKKLHSNDNGNTFLQSVDYAYNIKGWLTKTNNASDSDPGETDYFGMEMGYEADQFGAGASARKDGFISATKWRNDLTTNQNLYQFDYDNMGRLTSALFKSGTNSAWTGKTDFYSEKGITYDFNGNIQTLQRNKVDTVTFASYQTIDNLAYHYGVSAGNQLMKVDESSTPALKDLGFKDGNTTGDDYGYDKNGNLVWDKNKSINEIQYNFLNLPVKVLFSDGTYITYLYNSAGARLTQANFSASGQPVLKADYVGAHLIINDEPAIIFHEEGRLLPPAYSNLVVNREANGTEGFSPAANTTITSVYQNGQTFLKAVSNQATGNPGVLMGTYNVNPGEQYSFKVLGYRHTAQNAYLYVKSNTGNIVWTGALLPQGQANETWATSEFVVPAGINQITIGVLWSNPVSGATVYINRVALYKIDWEYQYFLSDHLGSPRVVLSTNPSTQKYIATFESENQNNAPTDESSLFFNINTTRLGVHPSNVTPGGNEVINLDKDYRVGPSRSLKVYPGDEIDASVSAYYQTMSGLTKASAAIISSALVDVMTAGGLTGIDGGVVAAYNKSANGATGFALSPNNGATRPSAFLNYILFDERYVPLEAKSVPVGPTAGVTHTLSFSGSLGSVAVKQVGYLFVYLSYDNENTTPVYFDELKIIHEESPMVQVNDYYPFGMTSYSCVREGEYQNRFLFQGKEKDEKTGWHGFHARQYDGAIGRFWSIDPKNQFASGYVGMGNNPVIGVDPDGEWVHIVIGAVIGGVVNWATHGAQFNGQGLKYFGVGAAAGALTAGIGAGVNVAMAGGSFGAGFAGTATGVASTGFISGAATGAAAGFTNGFISGTSNSLIGGSSFGSSLGSGLKTGGVQGLIGGVTGGIGGGLDARSKDLNFWNGTAELNLSEGVGAHGFIPDKEKIIGKYVGKFEGVNVYETPELGTGYGSGGITLPGRGITVGKGVFSRHLDFELLQHEFGHVLQTNQLGAYSFLKDVGLPSINSANQHGVNGWNHNEFWTEVWANNLSNSYFDANYSYLSQPWNYRRFPLTYRSPSDFQKVLALIRKLFN